jgi:hypothetical protein
MRHGVEMRNRAPVKALCAFGRRICVLQIMRGAISAQDQNEKNSGKEI